MSSAGIRPGTNTSALATAAAVAAIDAETDKIDTAAVDGMAGTEDSLAWYVEELQVNLRGEDLAFGKRTVQTLPTEAGVRLADGDVNPYVLTAGNDDWGAWTQLIGDDDLPITVDGVSYRPTALLVTQTTRAAQLYLVQFVYGAAPAGAVAQSSDLMFYSTTQTHPLPSSFRMRRGTIGAAAYRLWARLYAPGQNADTLSGYLLLHEYPG